MKGPVTLLLGSSSPRRQELLTNAGFVFNVISGTVDETPKPGLPIHDVAESLAVEKSDHIWKALPSEKDVVLLTADTVVLLEESVLGKPVDYQDAFAMLSALSGRSHWVMTGIAIRNTDRQAAFTVATEVIFNPLSEQTIDYYIRKYKPFDKAGAYGIQEWIGLVGIRGIRGDFYNVMGLPVSRLVDELEGFGCTPESHL